ncbi:MAG TPA: DNA repair protein RecN [Nitrospiraceae bacterium]|jgi:DNA repair protein RecN (Recombination protein N)|nr:DNA repair protein RecN [Nitrospiraceae bacterium]
MLRQLRIKDFAIIDDLMIRFEPGLNVLTGETGAGKSIIVDALGLALGERAQSDMVRTGKRETVVEAFFETTEHPMIDRLGIPMEEGIILRRTLLSSGKSRAYINDTMVNVQTLLEFGRSLVDIHGQHEHQSLLSTENQRALLDAYGKLIRERLEVERLFSAVQSMKKEISHLTANTREKVQRIDLLMFQIQEIDSSSLKQGEKEVLGEERNILANLAKLKELTNAAYSVLYSEDGSLSERLSSAVSMLRDVSQVDQGIAEILALLESAKPLIEDASSSLRSYRERYDSDPDRLVVVEDRLDFIKRLERKYGEGIDEILRYREDADEELRGLTLSDERLKALEGSLSLQEKLLYEKAAELTDLRRKVSGRIAAVVKSILKELGMEKAEFTIEIKPDHLSSTGMDSVEFLFSANEGEPPKPLRRTASGGELSRVMLAVKETLAEVDRIPVLIFDEVDAGIGGRAAASVGMRLKSLARRHQVLCITHLPHIAAMADYHMVIEKIQKKDGVSVTVKEASREGREEEIARMLSGTITDISRKHARELLRGKK